MNIKANSYLGHNNTLVLLFRCLLLPRLSCVRTHHLLNVTFFQQKQQKTNQNVPCGERERGTLQNLCIPLDVVEFNDVFQKRFEQAILPPL
jgi:hypothetical protein